MFRRKRSSSQHHHPLSSSSTHSAQSAATHAFLKSQPSSSSLSSAAAAAALRSLTPTPTAVENVQTKRMLQRQASLSSQTGIASGRPSSRNGLRRTSSSGSMAARTFRDQSPRRPASSSGTASVAPPLPAIPREYTTRRNQNRRSVSLGPNVWSPLPNKQAPETTTNMEGGIGEPSSPRSIHTSGSMSPEHQRSGSRNSINFSYPMNSRTNSPTMVSGFPDCRDPAIGTPQANHIPAQVGALQNQGPVSSPPHRSGPRKPRGSGPGSPGRSPQSAGTAVAAAQAAVVPRADEPNLPLGTPRGVRHREQTAHGQSPNRSPASAASAALADHQKSRTVPNLVKRPSTVVEDRHAEQGPADSNLQGGRGDNAPTERVSPEGRATVMTPPITERAPDSLHSPLISSPESNISTDLDQDNQLSHLHQSSSPGRTARFSTRLSVMNYPGEHLHQPPARSVSPVKPALKHPRKSSLSPDGRIQSVLRPGPLLTEFSDATSVASDDGSRPNIRKRAVKVSFDDEAEVMGVAASPPTSPEDIFPESHPGKDKSSKTNWLGFHKRKSSPLRSIEADEFDGMLKPRPALPSFGSIRGGRDGGRQEIILQELSDNESTASSASDMGAPNWSFANDNAVGAIISRASQEDVYSRGQPEKGPWRMHEEHAESQKENIAVGQDGSDPQTENTNKMPISPPADTQPEIHQVLAPNPNLAVPDIAVQPATPGIEKGRPSLEGYEIPGGFPRSSVDFESISQKKAKRGSYVLTDGTPTTDTTNHEETDDESSESIYSDAEEELKGDGFGSINAIVDNDETVSDPTDNSELGTEPVLAPRSGNETTEHAIPETCKIARVMTPVPEVVDPSISESPDSSTDLVPFSSPYPPFPLRPKPKQSSSPARIPRSSTMPAQIMRDSMPVEIHSIAQVPRSYRRQESIPRSDTAEFGAPHLRHNVTQIRDQGRPASWGPIALKGKNTRLNGGEQHFKGVNVPIAQRPLSNGSDSSSSFKRSSRPPRSEMSMRRTLRGHQGNVPQSPSHISNISSAESRPFSSGSGAGSMRTTLRGSIPKPEKPSFFSTNKSQRGRNVKVQGTAFSSRFADSDSDSDGQVQNRRLHRRRKTLSNEDLRPVRGIPRRQGAHDGDSTELEDSSDNERRASTLPRLPARRLGRSAPPPRDPALAAVAKSRGMTEEELEKLLTQPRGGRRPSLFQRFSIKKPKPSSEPSIPQFHLDNAAKNRTLVEQGSSVLPDSGDYGPPKLLKKASQKSSSGETWPLSSDQAESASVSLPANQPLERPQTSDGFGPTGALPTTMAMVPERPLDEVKQPATNGINGTRASDIVIEPSGRKKRFSRIRKAFGLRN